MDKIIFKLIALVGFFLLTLLAVNQVNWMQLFGVKENISSTEQKVGELFWEFFASNNQEVTQDKILLPVDSLLLKICTANGIEREEINLHIIKKEEVNAFALPNKHLVIFTGLLTNVKNEAELSGVIGHELAHIQLDHVMKKLVKEIGLAVLISITTGNGNSQVLIKSLKTLTSSAYDRSLEEDADIKSVEYLIKADINPTPFADFLYSLGGEDAEMEEYMSWISTHPYSKERAEEIIHYCQDKTYQKEPVLHHETWKQLKNALQKL